ncbi:MAG: ABC transporter substrate-binding protein [Methanomassiliicoccales archaeon]
MKLDKRKKIVVALIVVILVSIPLIAFLALNQLKNEGPEGLISADALGRTVTVDSYSRIVSCAPDITELVCAMGKGANLVGVTTYCDYPQEVVDRKSAGTLVEIGGYWTPSLESIVEAEPTLILISSGVQAHTDLLPQMESLNLTVVALYPGKNMTEVAQNIRLMGIMFRDEQKAEEILSEMEEILANIRAITTVQPVKPKVLFALWLDPVYTTGGSTYVDEIISMAGGRNVFGDLNGWPQPSMEQIIEASPDVIIVSGTMMMQTPQQIIEGLENDSFWSTIPAVQNHRVYVVVNQAENTFLRQGVRMVEATQLLAEILYPDEFDVQVPNVIGNEYHEYLKDMTGLGKALVLRHVISSGGA